MTIDELILEKVNDLQILSEKDGTDFLNPTLREELKLKIITNVKKSIQYKISELSRDIEEQRNIYDDKYEYDNFKFDKNKLLEGDLKQLDYYISSDYKEYNSIGGWNRIESIYNYLNNNSKNSDLEILEKIFDIYYDGMWTYAEAIKYYINNVNLSYDERIGIIKNEYNKLEGRKRRDFCKDVYASLFYDFDFADYFIKKYDKIDDFIIIPLYSFHSNWKELSNLENIIRLIKKNNRKDSMYYGCNLKYEEGRLDWSIREGTLSKENYLSLIDFTNKDIAKTLIIKEDSISLYRIKSTFEKLYDIYGADKDLLEYFLSYKEKSTKGYTDYRKHSHEPPYYFYKIMLKGATYENIKEIIDNKEISKSDLNILLEALLKVEEEVCGNQ